MNELYKVAIRDLNRKLLGNESFKHKENAEKFYNEYNTPGRIVSLNYYKKERLYTICEKKIT